MPFNDELDFMQAPRIKRLRDKMAQAQDESDRQKFLTGLMSEVVNKLSSVTVSKIDDEVTVNNLDEVQAALRNELKRVAGPLLAELQGMGLTAQEQKQILHDIEVKSAAKFEHSFQPVYIKRPYSQVEVLNISDILFPEETSVMNLGELKPYFDELTVTIKESFDVPAPQVTVNPPEINIPPVNIPETDLTPIVTAIEKNLQKIRTNGATRPLAVRLSDGQKWIKELVKSVDSMKNQFAGFANGVTQLKGRKGGIINPATEGSVGPATGGGQGTKTVTTAGTPVQVSATSVPCREVFLCGDLSNTNPVVVGFSNAVDASGGSMAGIIVIPGNVPVSVRIDNLNKLWVDSQTNGDELCYAYLT